MCRSVRMSHSVRKILTASFCSSRSCRHLQLAINLPQHRFCQSPISGFILKFSFSLPTVRNFTPKKMSSHRFSSRTRSWEWEAPRKTLMRINAKPEGDNEAPSPFQPIKTPIFLKFQKLSLLYY